MVQKRNRIREAIKKSKKGTGRGRVRYETRGEEKNVGKLTEGCFWLPETSITGKINWYHMTNRFITPAGIYYNVHTKKDNTARTRGGKMTVKVKEGKGWRGRQLFQTTHLQEIPTDVKNQKHTTGNDSRSRNSFRSWTKPGHQQIYWADGLQLTQRYISNCDQFIRKFPESKVVAFGHHGPPWSPHINGSGGYVQDFAFNISCKKNYPLTDYFHDNESRRLPAVTQTNMLSFM